MLRSLFVAAIAILAGSTQIRAGDKDTYQIGVPKSFFRDIPADLLPLAGQPFEELFKEQTGLKGAIAQESDAMSVAKKIDSGELQLGVLFGHEFACVREKFPNLQPIFCAVDRPKKIQALILVRHDCKAASLKDMPEPKLALAKALKDHARLYLDKQRIDDMGSGDFKTEKVETVHDAIYKVIDGSADLTVADSASWAYFEKVYPGQSKNLRILSQSAEFPPAVLVCKKGAIDETSLKKIRDGFLSAHENSKARPVLTAIRIEKFDAVPENYDEQLKQCLKAYPKPIDEKLTERSSAGK